MGNFRASAFSSVNAHKKVNALGALCGRQVYTYLREGYIYSARQFEQFVKQFVARSPSMPVGCVTPLDATGIRSQFPTLFYLPVPNYSNKTSAENGEAVSSWSPFHHWRS